MFANKKILILAVLFLGFFWVSGAHAALTCQIRQNSCNAGEVAIFKMYSLTNSEAELPSQTNYSNIVCCGGVTGLGNSCSGNFAVPIRLSSPTNAQVEKNTLNDYAYNACISAPTGNSPVCSYSTDCSTLGPDYVQLACISGDTNAHVDDCSTYSEKICCSIGAPSSGPYILSVSQLGSGSGTVSFNPPNSSFSLPHSESYSAGTSVVLTPVAAPGSTFAGWSGDCSGSGNYTITMNAPHSCTATFNISGPGTGCQSHNVSGYAWSENTGWLSMSCQNTMALGAGNDYGVDINNLTGVFSGYAWSENIGWVDFAPAGPYPSSPQFSARVDMNGTTCGGIGKVCGWARALSYGGGWDGWIKLQKDPSDGGSSYGTWIDGTVSPAQFRNFAWGSDVVGWLSFNRSNCDANGDGLSDGTAGCPAAGTPVANYKVTTTFIPNHPPVAAMSCQIINCNGPGCYCGPGTWITYNGNGVNFFIANNSTDPDPGDSVVSSVWSIIGYQDPYLNCPLCGFSMPSIPSSASQPGGVYQIELEAVDSRGSSDTTTQPIQVKSDIVADFGCSRNLAGPYVSCSTFYQLSEGQVIYFNASPSVASEGATISNYSWSFGASGQIASTTFSSGSQTVSLTVTDTAGRTASQQYAIDVYLPLPKWWEVPPVSWVRNLFASVSSFVYLSFR